MRSELFCKSAFAHGYMHGYEEGFHSGDLDLQMGRGYHDVKGHDKFKKGLGYKPEFGNRGVFDTGYRNGYLVGYTDAYAGRNFRAVQLIKELPDGKNLPPVVENREFDNAFMQGYETGQKKGLEDGRSEAAEGAAPLQCQKELESKGSTGEPRADYCEAFRGGYQLGYSDGFANQRDATVLAAR